MKKLKYNFLNSFLYLTSILTIAIAILTTYNKIPNNKKTNLGFREAKAITSSNEICIGNSNNIECQKNLLKDFKKTKNSLLFFGNSQTGSINNFNQGDQTFITYLNQLLKFQENDFEGKGIWLPNANMREFEIIYKGLKKCNLEPQFLVIPIFLDDIRIDLIRNELNNFSDFLCGDISNMELNQNSIGGNLDKLNLQINKRIKLFNELKNLNEKFRTDIYKFRNLVFNINPTTVRPIKKIAYKNNLISLKNIIYERNTRNLETIVYIPPLLFSNKKNKIPYKETDYAIFKDEIEKICEPRKCIYFNLEKSVPNSLWGLKASTKFNKGDFELDFMHFTSKGHKVLAEKFIEILSANLNKLK